MKLASGSEAARRRGGAARLLLVVAASLTLLLLACTDPVEEPDVATSTPTISAGVTTATPSRTASPVGEEAAVDAWGRRVCAAAGAFTLDFLASGDARDPNELSLDERKQRAEAMFPVQYDAVRAAARTLEAIDPPLRTAELHALLLDTYRDLDAALREQEQVIAEATSSEQIADSNLPVDELASLAFRQASLLADGGYCE